jgi:hypothetical protein
MHGAHRSVERLQRGWKPPQALSFEQAIPAAASVAGRSVAACASSDSVPDELPAQAAAAPTIVASTPEKTQSSAVATVDHAHAVSHLHRAYAGAFFMVQNGQKQMVSWLALEMVT